MNLIKGKQIQDNSITQSNMFIETESVINNTDVTNKGYVNQVINEKSSKIYQSRLNQHMTVNNATVGQKSCDSTIIEFPISNILVKVNGTFVNTGEGLDCYFSPDGTTIRTNGRGQKGDYLYWNSSKYDLSTDDEVDFNYLVAYDHYTLSSGTTVTLDPIYNNMVVKYTGDSGTTMSVVIDGVTFIVGNVGGNFVWDIGGVDEYTFTSPNESIVVNINGEDYTIWFDGFGSLIFSVKKGNYKSDLPEPFITEWDMPIGVFEFPSGDYFQYDWDPDSPTGFLINEDWVWDYTIDWGDGSPTEHITSMTHPTHEYVEPLPNCQIKITGSLPTFRTVDDLEQWNVDTLFQNLKSIVQWGNVGFKDFSESFYGLTHQVTFPSGPITGLGSNVSMSYMFDFNTVFNEDISNWDVSNVTDMSGMFNSTSSFNQNIGNWNTSNVTNMNSMFYGASSFNQNIGNWNTSNVTDMRTMFYESISFDQDLSNWCVPNITEKPLDFDFNTSNWNKTDRQPIWGECPSLVDVKIRFQTTSLSRILNIYKNNVLIETLSNVYSDYFFIYDAEIGDMIRVEYGDGFGYNYTEIYLDNIIQSNQSLEFEITDKHYVNWIYQSPN